MRLLRLRWIVAVLMQLLMVAYTNGQSTEEMDTESLEHAENQAKTTDKVDSSAAAKQIVDLTNVFRKEQDVEPVETNENLMDAAQYFAEFMAGTDKYGHSADGARPSERASRHNYDYCLVSENIAYQFSSLGFTTEGLATKFVEGWKESPGHRKNMLDPAVIDIGVAVARSDKTGYWYAVQMFGRPQSAAIEFAISNQSNVDIVYSIGERKFQLPPRYTRTHSRCRQVEIDFAAPLARADKSITPANGARYTLQDQGEGLRLEKTSSNAQ
jgi:uncharacterized protein YkwD